VILHDVRLVTKAQNKIPMPILAVILHDVPEDWLMADRYHRLRNILRILANPRTKSSTKQNNLHAVISPGPITPTFGIGTTILQPHAPTWLICSTISFFKFQGRISK